MNTEERAKYILMRRIAGYVRTIDKRQRQGAGRSLHLPSAIPHPRSPVGHDQLAATNRRWLRFFFFFIAFDFGWHNFGNILAVQRDRTSNSLLVTFKGGILCSVEHGTRAIPSFSLSSFASGFVTATSLLALSPDLGTRAMAWTHFRHKVRSFQFSFSPSYPRAISTTVTPAAYSLRI